jgi:hypothetical protein
VEAEGTGPQPQAAAPPPPPPPTDVLGPADLFAEDANAQALRKRLKRGRLHIQLVTAKNVRRKDQVATPTNLNAYVVALLGKTKEPVKAKSEVREPATCPTHNHFRPPVPDILALFYGLCTGHQEGRGVHRLQPGRAGAECG